MAITAAEIEANGYVLRLTITGGLTAPNTNFGAYNFDINGTPRMSLAVSDPGFVKSAGTAIAGTNVRTLIGLKPLRMPVNPPSVGEPGVAVLDEVSLGGGSIQVRLFLSEHIYANSTALVLSTLAGWRPGEGAQSGIAVTNSSIQTAPLPIMRWVLPSYDVTTGSFRLSLLVAANHPKVFDPVAGVKFTVTDGTTVKTMWATALANDNTYGDNLRCHTVMIDPATATALTAGLLRCDAEVYPWLGAMRTTDPAGTKTMVSINFLGFASSAEAPYVIGYDPAGTRYTNVYAFIDPVNGSVTSSAAMIAATPALAKAVAPASRPRDITTAQRALRNLSRTLDNRQGAQYGATGSVDGLVCILAAGIHSNGFGSTAQSAAGQTYEIPITIVGDSTDANPRANCILQTRAAGPVANNNVSRYRFRNMTIEQGESAFSAAIYKWLDNVEIRSKTGFGAVTTAPMGGGVGINNWNWAVTNSKIWRSAWSLAYGASGPAPGLLRASQFSRNTAGICIVKCRTIGSLEDGTVGYGAAHFRMHSGSTLLGAKEDFILAYNDCRYLAYGQQILYTSPAASALAGTLRDSHRRHLIMNNLLEYILDDQGALFGYGESEFSTTSRQIIIEGNTTAGAGFNVFYNDPDSSNLTNANTLFNETYDCILRNNAVDRNASKQDDFNDSQAGTSRAGAYPYSYRPHLVQGWAVHNGTNMEGHVDCGRSGSIGSFRRDGLGPRSSQYAVVTQPGYTNDLSYNANPANTGGGNYVPATGSVMLNRIKQANSDVDLVGNARFVNGAAGALEGPAPSGWTENTTLKDTVGGTVAAFVGLTAGSSRVLSGPAVVSGHVKPNNTDPLLVTAPVKGITPPPIGINTVSFTITQTKAGFTDKVDSFLMDVTA